MRTQFEIFPHLHVRKNTPAFGYVSYPESGNAVSRHFIDSFFEKFHGPGCRAYQAGYGLEDRAFAGAVGPDDAPITATTSFSLIFKDRSQRTWIFPKKIFKPLMVSIIIRSQIDFDNRFISGDFLGYAFRYFYTVMQDDYAVAYCHDGLHDMLND